MFNETTLYIKDDLLSRLDRSADKMGISRSRLVSLLLITYMKNNQAGGKVFSRLKYQERNIDSKYSTKSLYLRKDVYEMWCDVRKAFKLSASHLVALSIELYLDKITNRQIEPNNYFGMYITETIYDKTSCMIQIVWGKPEEKNRQAAMVPV